MKRQHTPLLWAIALLVLAAVPMQAHLSEYRFSTYYGEWISPGKGATVLLGAGADDDVSKVQSIGFPFEFDGVTYTEFSVGSNGLIGLGNRSTSACWVNMLTQPNGLCSGVSGYDYTLASTPHIAPYWDDLRVPDAFEDGFEGQILYHVQGSEPNRILVVTFQDVETDYFGYNYSTWQARLYEGSNAIEFYYDYLNPDYFSDGGSIGLAIDGSNFVSVTPEEGGMASATSKAPNDYVYPSDYPIPGGMVYAFAPCQVTYTGDIDQGGTEKMAEGDTLLVGKGTMAFTTESYTPFWMSYDEFCGQQPMSASIEGPNASDYTFEPTDFVVTSETVYGSITFRPTGTGIRRAELHLTDENGKTRIYYLAAEGYPRIMYTGDIPQGGTAAMKSGDVLMSEIHVRRGQSGDFTPFMLTNILDQQQEAPDAQVTYRIKGMSGGQYSIDPTSTSLASGESHTPTITFRPTTTIGPVLDSLYVTADGETRVFALLAISDGVGALLVNGNATMTNGDLLFVNKFSCAGVEPVTLPITVRNVGNQPFQVTGADFFQTDTVYQQGTPRYPLIRRNEMPVRSQDYIITEMPPVVPITQAQAMFPMTVEVGATKTLYFTFIGQEPGKRFARAFVHTNAENFAAVNQYDELVEGLITFDLFGRGLSARLSDRPDGGLPKPLDFGPQRVGFTATKELTITNNGVCPLRVSMPMMEIVAGDVDEFKIVSKPSTHIDAATGDLLLGPGESEKVTISFTASQHGSRRAGLRLVTNDSAISMPGITERGVFYVDLYGMGQADLYAENADLGVALIGGDATEHRHGVVRLVNTQNKPVIITGMVIEGPDGAEFTQDPAKAWPSFPALLESGDPIELGIEFAPGSSGSPGPRTATLKIYLENGDSVMATLNGIAGTRTVSVTPPSLNFSVSSGGQARKSVMITNTGTMPLKVTGMTVSNPDFSIGSLDRTELLPGQTEHLEITFTPQGPGTSTDQLVIESNGTNGSQNVALNGAARTKRKAEDPASAPYGNPQVGGEVLDAAQEFSLSGVTGVRDASGMALLQSVPNPARDVVEIGWVLPTSGTMKLELYDATGRVLRVLENGIHSAGEGRVRVDVTDFAAGTYHYRLTSAGRSLVRTLTVVR